VNRNEKALRRAATQAAVEHVQPPIEFPELVGSRLRRSLARYSDNPLPEPADMWCLLESPEGEYPRIRGFKKLLPLLEYLKNIEGTETAVAVVQGTPLSLSKVLNGKRYLLIGDSAICIGDSSATVLPQSALVGLARQQDGWLGDSLYTLDTEDDANG